MKPPLAILLLCGPLVHPSSAQEDVLILEDGRVFDGLELSRVDGGVRIHFAHGEVEVPARLIHDALVSGESGYVPKTPQEKEKLEQGYVRFEGRWITLKRRDRAVRKRIEARRAEIEEMRAHREWGKRYLEDTKNFAFEFTVPRHVFEGYRDRMEAYFQVFAKDWKVKRPRDRGKLSVCFYGNRREFHRVSGAPGNVVGYFKFYPDFDLNIYHDRLDPAYTEDVMFHEANHYLQKLIDVGFSYPHWPGEALAEYYGASAWNEEKGRLSTGLVQEGRLIEIQDDITGGEMWDLRGLITAQGAYEHYTWGWSLVHFLMNDPDTTKRFQRFFLALAKGKNVKRESAFSGLRTVSPEEVWRVFQSTMGLRSDEDVAELEERWHDYVRNQLELVTPRGKEKAAVAAMGTGRPIRAKRLFREAIAAGTENPITYHKYAGLLMREGETSAAIENWERAVELDPLTGTFRYALGRALARKGRKEEGERQEKLALEIDPEAAKEWWWD